MRQTEGRAQRVGLAHSHSPWRSRLGTSQRLEGAEEVRRIAAVGGAPSNASRATKFRRSVIRTRRRRAEKRCRSETKESWLLQPRGRPQAVKIAYAIWPRTGTYGRAVGQQAPAPSYLQTKTGIAGACRPSPPALGLGGFEGPLGSHWVIAPIFLERCRSHSVSRSRVWRLKQGAWHLGGV